MVIRWQYYLRALSATVITGWHYRISVDMVTGWVYWIVNVSNCKELWIARRKHQHLQSAGKDHYLGKRIGVPQKESEKDSWAERERKMEGGCSAS